MYKWEGNLQMGRQLHVITKEKKETAIFLPISSLLMLNVNAFVIPHPPRLYLSNEWHK